jgi:uncharacterized protein (DUF1330 family)
VSGAFGVALLREVKLSDAMVRYLEAVEATFAPFGGRLLVHGGVQETLEGECPGELVIVGFPDRERARAWYGSAAYQAILPLRRANARGEVILVDAVPEGHRATAILTAPATQADGLDGAQNR